MQTLESDAVLEIPESVAICPYCDTKLIAQFEAWTQEEDGTWKATGMNLDCETEPDDSDTDEWEEWMQQHSGMPYVYMLPIHNKVEAWVNENYRFKM